jgi:cytoskeletal protein CcmA (bactofilin family)
MSWGRKDKENETEAWGSESAPKTEMTYIDHGCEMVGTLRFRENVRIDGHIEGEIYAEKTVIIGEEATVRAQIRAANVVVHGTVEGDIFASGETTLHKSAAVTGELQTGGIVVERGARLKGCILIGSDADECDIRARVDGAQTTADEHSIPSRVPSDP